MTAIARAGHRSRHHRHSLPRSSRRTSRKRQRLALALGQLPLASGLMLGSAVAERAPAVSRVSAPEAAQLGQSIVIARHDDLAQGLAEVRVPSAIAATRATGADQLLAVAPDLGTVAIAGQVGPQTTSLIMVRADGSQVQVELPGLIAAAFAPDEAWLAAIDGRGTLWRVAPDGAARQIASGPYIGQPIVEPSGSIVVLRVPSVEAPYRAELVRVTADGAAAPLTAEPLVYGVELMADGSLAAVAHRPSGTVVLGLSSGKASMLADLGADAVNVAVDRAASAVAWERAGRVYLQRLAAGRPELIGPGTHPRFSADGESVLLEVPTGTQLFNREGDLIATFSTQLDFAACGQACAP